MLSPQLVLRPSTSPNGDNLAGLSNVEWMSGPGSREVPMGRTGLLKRVFSGFNATRRYDQTGPPEPFDHSVLNLVLLHMRPLPYGDPIRAFRSVFEGRN